MITINLKYTLVTIATAAVTLATPTVAFARNGATTTLKTNLQTSTLETLHTVCDSAIDKRIASLKNLETKIDGFQKLTDAQKTDLKSQIEAEIASLTTLKAKCDADTDLETLKADFKSVFTVYRVYAVFEPQIRIAAAADRIMASYDKLSDLKTKLTDKANEAGNPGDTSALLTDMQAKLDDAKAKVESALAIVSALTPDMYNTDRPATEQKLQSARADLKTARLDLVAAMQDAQKVKVALGITGKR